MGFRRVQLFISLVTVLCHIAAQDDLAVETELGKIQGSTMSTVHGREIKAFRGIRYAQAPIRENRFKPPVAVPPWGDSVFDATKDGYICPQPSDESSLISEDCLVLNVYTGDLKGKTAVMVFFHGGVNVLRSSHNINNAGPGYLLDYDIVLVTMNFRLGALGFLSTGTEEAPENYGYLDQVMTLQWVHDHISKFGGDPDLVTIFGISSGGMAVTLHMVSPLSQGLFHRAIAMSGSATNHFNIDNKGWTTKLARYTSCPMYNPKDLVDCLRNVSWEKIIEVCSTFESAFTIMKWHYQVDGYFLLDTPTKLFVNGNFSKVPLITGITKDELNYSIHEQENNTALLNDASVNFKDYAPENFQYNPKEYDAYDKSRRIQEFYLDDKKIQDQPLINYGKIFSDAVFIHGMHRLVHLAKQHTNVFNYRFDYAGRYSQYVDAEGKTRGSVAHADDIQYIFESTLFGGQSIGLQDPEMFMVKRITGWWTSFARNGAPDENKWQPITSDGEVITAYNGKTVSFGGEPYLERLELWDAMFPASSAETIEIAWMLTAGAITLHVVA